jgi:hypothetical protein
MHPAMKSEDATMTLSRQTPDNDRPDIRVPLDTVCFIISKAHQFGVGTGPAEAEMISYISDLNQGAQIDLVAIMWLGRDEGPDDWAEAQQIATEEHNDHTAQYLVGTPLLADYLEEGLSRIGRDCSDYNELNV